MRPPWLKADTRWFPPTSTALKEPNGLLALGGDLTPARLIEAYQRGIFPWYSEGQPILWWSPNPRVVMYPGEVHISGSLKKFLRKSPWRVRINQAFPQVLKHCAAPRADSHGTWLLDEMQRAYIQLHQQGVAHSIEVWADDELVGGLYGVALGRVFFGESMFSRRENGSKVALVALSQLLKQAHFVLIDCQVGNPHLFSMGALTLPRATFEALLQHPNHNTPPPWPIWSEQSFPCEHFIQP
ncbi:MAG: leucyl/phenylalanyl-tRNA--protein transferase [Pseudomonadota bacterium]|jgi:leucyl/phenylalanyl-tRNA--protein transferase